MSTQHWSTVVTLQTNTSGEQSMGTYRWWKPGYRDLLSCVTFLLVVWPVLCFFFSFSTRELVQLRKRRELAHVTVESHVCTNRLRVHLESAHPIMNFGNDFCCERPYQLFMSPSR